MINLYPELKTIRIHLVKKQLFYAPLFNAVSHWNNKHSEPRIELVDKTNNDTYKENYLYDFKKGDSMSSSKGIIPLLFNKGFQQATANDCANLFLSGGKDFIDFNNAFINNNNTKHSVLWSILVTRLPILYFSKNGKIDKEKISKIYTFPESTTLDEYIKKHISDDWENTKKDLSGDQPSIQIVRITGDDFEQTVEALNNDSDNNAIAFSTGIKKSKSNVKLVTEGGLVPHRIIPFTCIFGYNSDFEKPKWRERLLDFFAQVKKSAEEFYEDSKYVLNDENAQRYNSLIKEVYNDKSSDAEHEIIIKQVKQFADRRIWQYDFIEEQLEESPSNNENKGLINDCKSLLSCAPFAPEKHKVEQKNLLEIQSLSLKLSQVLNRNYSHHIGSHVSYRAGFNEVYKRINPNSNGEICEISKDKIIEENDGVRIRKATLDGIIRIIKYLEAYKDERNSFIASIDSYQTPNVVNFYSDTIRPFIENTLLIDNLAKSEGVQYKCFIDKKQEHNLNDDSDCNNSQTSNSSNELELNIPGIAIRVIYSKPNENSTHNCNSCKKDEEYSGCKDLYNLNREEKEIYTLYFIDENLLGKTEFCSRSYPYLAEGIYHRKNNIEDLPIVVPGPLGRHSIYSILENIIRNTAKHGKEFIDKMKDKRIEIIIKLIDNPIQKHYAVEIYTNIPTCNKVLVEELKRKLKIPIIETDALGFADIRYNILFLNRLDMNDKNLNGLDIDTIDYSAVTGESIEDTLGDCNSDELKKIKEKPLVLKYLCKLLKPQHILFFDIDKEKKPKQHLPGIDFVNSSDYLKSIFKEETVVSKQGYYNFAVLNSDTFKAFYDNIVAGDNYNKAEDKDVFIIKEFQKVFKYLPMKVLVQQKEGAVPEQFKIFNEIDRVRTFNKEIIFVGKDSNELLLECWEEWTGIERTEIKKHVAIYDNTKIIPEFNKNLPSVDEFKSYCYPETKNDASETPQMTKPSNGFVLYDRHGLFYNCNDLNSLNFNFTKPEQCYIEFDKASPDFEYLTYCKELIYSSEVNKQTEKQLALYNLYYQGNCSILVLDERVAEMSYEQNKKYRISSYGFRFRGIDYISNITTLNDCCRASNVFVATDLNDKPVAISHKKILMNDLSVKINPVESNQFYAISNSNTDKINYPVHKFNVLIIHRTIWLNLKDDERDCLIKTIPNIYINSGGGKLPAEYEPSYKFLQFEELKRHVCSEIVSKNSLVSNLF